METNRLFPPQLRLGCPDAAATQYRAALNRASKYSRPSASDVAIRFSQFLCYRLGNNELANEVINEAIELESDNAELYRIQIEIVSKGGQCELNETMDSVVSICGKAAQNVNESEKYFFLKKKFIIFETWGLDVVDLKAELEQIGNDDVATTHKCNACDKVFSEAYNLNKHLKEHSSNIYCTKCNKSFISLLSFNSHKKEKGMCKHACKCGKSYVNKSALAKHVEKYNHK